jgi:hypothetical protein
LTQFTLQFGEFLPMSKKPSTKQPTSPASPPIAKVSDPATREGLSLEERSRLHQAFEPVPLDASQGDLYVNLNSVRGQTDIVAKLFNRIQLNPKPKSWLVAGHKGCGKSTELRRLSQQLELVNDARRYLTVICTERDIDTVNVEFTEVMIVMLQRVATELRERCGVRLDKNTFFREFFHRLKQPLFPTFQVDKLELTAGLARISASIKGSPKTRQDVREILSADTATLQQEINDLLRDATEKLRTKGYAGLVVIFDSLDRIADREQAETLFVGRATEMTGFECQMVFTMPISLAYAETTNQLANLYGSPPTIVPMTKLRGLPPDRQPSMEGIDLFRAMVDTRLNKAGVERDRVFASDEALVDLILATGGQPNELMSFMQELIETGAFPITQVAVTQLRISRSREYRWLSQEDWQVLEIIKHQGHYQPVDQTKVVLKRLLDGRAILHYLNAREWYDLNPIVQDIPMPSDTKGAPT